jgi:predicted MFS family arabinose efflux permease
VGWRQSLALAGVLGLITGVLVAAFLPSDSTGGGFRIDGGSLRKVLLDRQLILLGLGTMGFGFAYTDVSGFMNLYGVNELNVSPVVAGLVTSFITIVPIFTALWGGRAFDVIAAHRNIMVASIAGSGLALAIASVPTLYAAAACSVLGGVVTGIGYTFAFAGARELNRAGKEYESLAVGWVNSISLTGTSAPSFIFSQVAGKYGYGDAWLSGGLLTLAFVLPILLMVRIWRG